MCRRGEGGYGLHTPVTHPSHTPEPHTRGGALIRPTLRVASVPSDHVYVRHLAAELSGGPLVVRLADPPVPGAPAGQWWPSPVLTPSWVADHASEHDVVHVHFGYEHLSAEQLADWVAALTRPLVLTVHDLHNPHLVDQRPHHAALDVLVPAAAAVLTLTPGAAAEIARRWQVDATVVPHPHVVPLERLDRPRPASTRVVGLHDSARAGCDASAVRAELTAAATALGARVHPGPDRRLEDDELWDHLAGLDALVLPYTGGSHSGWVEACHDLGTAVLAPRRGHWHEQQAVTSYDLGVPGSLTAALARALAGPAPRSTRQQRAAQRHEVARVHADVYARVAA